MVSAPECFPSDMRLVISLSHRFICVNGRFLQLMNFCLSRFKYPALRTACGTVSIRFSCGDLLESVCYLTWLQFATLHDSLRLGNRVVFKDRLHLCTVNWDNTKNSVTISISFCYVCFIIFSSSRFRKWTVIRVLYYLISTNYSSAI